MVWFFGTPCIPIEISISIHAHFHAYLERFPVSDIDEAKAL